jgi:hypothetical protein
MRCRGYVRVAAVIACHLLIKQRSHEAEEEELNSGTFCMLMVWCKYGNGESR